MAHTRMHADFRHRENIWQLEMTSLIIIVFSCIYQCYMRECVLKWQKNALKTSGWGYMAESFTLHNLRVYWTFVASNFYQIPEYFDTTRLDCIDKKQFKLKFVSTAWFFSDKCMCANFLFSFGLWNNMGPWKDMYYLRHMFIRQSRFMYYKASICH